MSDENQISLTELTVELLSSYLGHNNVRAEDIPELISSTHAALKGLDASAAPAETTDEDAFKPAVTARKSLASPDKIISLIDGKPYTTLKRHLSGHGLTPQQYRERYKLPANYPMTAPAYSARRKELAHSIGLGRKPKAEAAAAEPAPAAAAPATPAKPARKPRAKATPPARS